MGNKSEIFTEKNKNFLGYENRSHRNGLINLVSPISGIFQWAIIFSFWLRLFRIANNTIN